MRALLAELGDPQRGLSGILVAGTNGKGSTCAMAESILRAAGVRTGLMPKPHLSRYTERIQVGRVPIPDHDFAQAVERLEGRTAAVTTRFGHATEFELLTAIAVDYLAPRVDRLVCEVGMGGRLDATNVLELGVSVITNVDLDHQRYLGNTIAQIATEKAAIIKPGDTALTAARGEALEVVEARATEVGASLWRLGQELRINCRDLGWSGLEIDVEGPGFSYRGLRVPLIGPHQAENAALAVAACQASLPGIPAAAIRRGLAATRWPGRLEVIPGWPRVVLDGAHNPAGMRAICGALEPLVEPDRLIAVFGALRDHDAAGMLGELDRLRPSATILTSPLSGRSLTPAELGALRPGAEVVVPAAAALERAAALAAADGTILIVGSLYLVGELRDPALAGLHLPRSG